MPFGAFFFYVVRIFSKVFRCARKILFIHHEEEGDFYGIYYVIILVSWRQRNLEVGAFGVFLVDYGDHLAEDVGVVGSKVVVLV